MDPVIGNASASAFQQVASALILALVGIITACIGLLAKKGLAYLQVKLGSTQLDTLKQVANMIVRSIEQNPVFAELDPASKKEKAILAITVWCEEHKVPVTYEFVDSLVEEAVQIMNAEIVKFTGANSILTGISPVESK